MTKIIEIKECSVLCPYYRRYNTTTCDTSHGLTSLACLQGTNQMNFKGRFIHTRIKDNSINCFLQKRTN